MERRNGRSYVYGLKAKYGATALVTGASSGIGKAFAKLIAADGISLVLVARRKELLEALAAELRQDYKIKVTVIAQDLLEVGAVEKVFAATEEAGIEINLLVNNAGFGIHGGFCDNEQAREQAMIDLNCSVPVALTRLYLPGMKARKRGGVIMVASLVGHMPIPYMATYAATKGFMLQLAASLYGECKGTAVDIIAASPGDTATEFSSVAELDVKFLVPARTSEQVAHTTLRALGRKPAVVDGPINKWIALMARFLPLKLLIFNNAMMWRLK